MFCGSASRRRKSLLDKDFGFLMRTQWYALFVISLYQIRNYVKFISYVSSCLPITYQDNAKNMMSFLMSYSSNLKSFMFLEGQNCCRNFPKSLTPPFLCYLHSSSKNSPALFGTKKHGFGNE